MKEGIKHISLIGLLFLLGQLPFQAVGQEDLKKVELHGYVKYMQTNSFYSKEVSPLLRLLWPGVPGDSGISLHDNLIHNRLNFRYYPNDNWTISIEARNRLLYGDQLRYTPGFADTIDQYNGLLDLSVRWVDTESFLLHSIIDRAYVEYNKGKWNVRLGRQRINWGTNLIWNPNDWFNAYNFLDFDYEERPGNDALRIQYYPGAVSVIDLAIAPSDSIEESVAAILYKFPIKGYDIQVLTGYFQGDYALGLGWEGNLGTLGFKGESSWFYPIEDLSPDTVAAFSASLTLDYLFDNGLYLSGGGLFNQRGESQEGGGTSFITGQLSAKNLFPSKLTYFVSASGQVNPLLSIGGSFIYAHNQNFTIFSPNITYSITENWDLDLIAQTFFLDLLEEYQHFSSSVYLRVKWSF